MSIIMWLVIGVGALIVVFTITFFVLKKNSKAGKNLFLLYRTRDSSQAEIIQGEIIVDKSNPSKKEYNFPQYNTRLPVTRPTKRIGGTWYRQVYVNNLGQLSYVTGSFLRDDGAEESKLKIEEKQLALYMFKEYQEQYQNPINKTQAVLVVAMFILAFIATAGAIYVTVTFAGNTTDIVTIAKENKEVSVTNKQNTAIMIDLVERLDVIASKLTGEYNFTRQI